MSNQTPNSDPVLNDDAPSPEESPLSTDDTLVQSVLADARELLETLGGGIAEEEADSRESEAPTTEDGFDPDSVAAVLDRVEHLVDDFDHLDEAVEEQPRSEPFDLTAVASKPPPSPEEQVPSHGPNGPEVDLFAAEPVAEPSTEPPVNPALGFEAVTEEKEKDEGPISEVGPPPQSSTIQEESPVDTSEEPDESAEDAAVRLEKLLADRLAEEYDVIEDLGQQQPVAQEAAEDEIPQSEIVVNESMGDSSESASETEFESVEPTDHELGLSSTRVIPAADAESVEMASIPGEPETSPPVGMSTIKEDVDATEPAMQDQGEAETSNDSVDPVESEASDSTDPSPNDVSSASSESGDRAGDECPEDDQPSTATEIEVEAETRSVLLSIATSPYRILPESFHRFVTPLALSLAIWVPITWTFAVVDPKPSAAATETLRPGFEGQDVEDGSRMPDDFEEEKRD